MNVDLIALIKTKKNNGKNKIGTGYPIANGKLLTARHVIYDSEQADNIEIEWIHSDTKEPFHKDNVDRENILYENAVYDIAVIKCKTPDGTDELFSNGMPPLPVAHDKWTSFGYPRTAKDPTNGIRKKDPAKGSFFEPDKHNHELHLQVDGNTNDPILWRGMSGAPIFHNNRDQLIAVLTQTPEKYVTDKLDYQGEYLVEETYKDRLFSTNILYLINNDETFRKVIGLSSDDLENYGIQREFSTDNEFLAQVRREIYAIIDMPIVNNALKSVLAAENNTTLPIEKKLCATDSKLLCELLDNELSKVIEKLKYTENYQNELKDKLRSLACNLSLFVIPEGWVKEAQEQISVGAVIEIPSKQEMIGATASARAYQTFPVLEAKTDSLHVQSKGNIETLNKQMSWSNNKQIINALIAHISNQVFPNPDSQYKVKDDDGHLPIINDDEINALNEHLIKTKQHYHIVLNDRDGFNYINNPEILSELWVTFPSLIMFKLTKADKSQLLIANDVDLRMAYQRFLVKL